MISFLLTLFKVFMETQDENIQMRELYKSYKFTKDAITESTIECLLLRIDKHLNVNNLSIATL